MLQPHYVRSTILHQYTETRICITSSQPTHHVENRAEPTSLRSNSHSDFWTFSWQQFVSVSFIHSFTVISTTICEFGQLNNLLPFFSVSKNSFLNYLYPPKIYSHILQLFQFWPSSWLATLGQLYNLLSFFSVSKNSFLNYLYPPKIYSHILQLFQFWPSSWLAQQPSSILLYFQKILFKFPLLLQGLLSHRHSIFQFSPWPTRKRFPIYNSPHITEMLFSVNTFPPR